MGFELRRGYVAWLIGIATILGAAVLIVGIALKMNLETFVLSIFAPVFPTILWTLRESKKQRETAGTLDRLRKYVATLWRDAAHGKLDDSEMEQKSRELQDELFVHRHTNQPVFDWVNRLLRKGYEQQMNIGAAELVAEGLQAADKQNPRITAGNQ